MACHRLNSITKDCYLNLGGIKRVLLNYAENVRFEFANGVATSYGVGNQDFVEYEPPRNSVNYNIQATTDDEGVTEYNHSISIKLNKRQPSKHRELVKLIEGRFDFVIIVQDANEKWWLLGYPFGLNVDTVDGGSGTTKGDGSFYNINFTGTQDRMEIPISFEATWM